MDSGCVKDMKARSVEDFFSCHLMFIGSLCESDSISCMSCINDPLFRGLQ